VEVSVVPASSSGFSAVESDLVALHRLFHSQKTTLSTLQNFANLMIKLPTIPVENYIGDLLTTSLKLLQEVPLTLFLVQLGSINLVIVSTLCASRQIYYSFDSCFGSSELGREGILR
jgi:hypothetical protein